MLAVVFRHDVAAIFGDIHVDAHAAATCHDPSHSHASPATPVVTPTISATRPGGPRA